MPDDELQHVEDYPPSFASEIYRRSHALRLALQIPRGLHKGCDARRLVRDARVIEKYLEGDDAHKT